MSCKQQVLVTVPFSTSRMRRLREAAGDDDDDPPDGPDGGPGGVHVFFLW